MPTYGPKDPFRLIVNRAELNRLLMSGDSEVALDLAKKAQRVAGSARRRAPRRTGRLKASIGWEIGKDEQGLYADVTSDAPYATPVEKGHRTESGTFVSPRRFLRPALFATVRGGRRRAR
jgi:hypothetical protein